MSLPSTVSAPRVTPRIHAHRGAAAEAPENTLSAFRLALELGVDGLEFDVHLTADGSPVVVHDVTLDRTTSGRGLVHESDLTYVRSLSAGSWFAPGYEAERVPLLEEVLALPAETFELELKGLPTPALVDAVAACVRNAGVESRLHVTGFQLPSIMRLREALPGARSGFFPAAYQPYMPGDFYGLLAIEIAALGAFDVIHVPFAHLGRVPIALARERHLEILGHTDDGRALPSLMAADVDIATSNDPRHALALRATR